MEKPLVSVLMATYNRRDFIEEAIESVLNQSYQNFELIIVDDGSTDDSKEVVANYMTDKRIKFAYQENQGQSVALNTAFKIATGEYAAVIDSDNRWLSNRLKLGLEEFAINEKVAVVYGDVIKIDENGDRQKHRNKARYSGRISALLLRDNFVTINTALIRSKSLRDVNGFDGRHKRAPDYDLWLRLSVNNTFKYIPHKLVEYRVMEDQISSNKDARFATNYKMISDFLNNHPDAVTFIERRRGLSSFYSRKSSYEKSKGRTARAWQDLRKSLTLFPFWSGPWRLVIKFILGIK